MRLPCSVRMSHLWSTLNPFHWRATTISLHP
jgi:hypothetical protein